MALIGAAVIISGWITRERGGEGEGAGSRLVRTACNCQATSAPETTSRGGGERPDGREGMGGTGTWEELEAPVACGKWVSGGGETLEVGPCHCTGNMGNVRVEAH